MDPRAFFTVAILSLCACQPPSDQMWPEDQPIGWAGAPQTATGAPDAGEPIDPPAEPGRLPMGLLGRPDGPILPLMDPGLVQVGVDLANEELEASGYDIRAEVVPTYQGTIDEISFYAGEEGTLGWTPGRVIFIAAGDLCESPPGYEGRLLVWVLAHEVLHTVGFDHGDEMKGMTDRLGPRCRDYCFSDEDAGI